LEKKKQFSIKQINTFLIRNSKKRE